MDFVNLAEISAKAAEKKQRKIDLFGADNFRSWMLYFVPGDGTDMHYHANPETFLVLAGTGTVRGIKGEERSVKKHDVLCLGTAGVIRQPLGGVRRPAYPHGRPGPEQAAKGR